MNKFEQKHKEIMESLTVNKNKAIMEQHFDEVSVDPNDSILESHFEQMNEGMPSKLTILNALEDMSAEEVAKKFKLRLADIKRIEKERLNEAEMSDEEIKDAVTKYIELKMKMKNEKQFNRKVDINRELKDFLKKHPDIRGKDDTARGTNIFYKDKKVASIKPQYANKKVNLTYKRLKNDAINFYI